MVRSKITIGLKQLLKKLNGNGLMRRLFKEEYWCQCLALRKGIIAEVVMAAKSFKVVSEEDQILQCVTICQAKGS